MYKIIIDREYFAGNKVIILSRNKAYIQRRLSRLHFLQIHMIFRICFHRYIKYNPISVL